MTSLTSHCTALMCPQRVHFFLRRSWVWLRMIAFDVDGLQLPVLVIDFLLLIVFILFACLLVTATFLLVLVVGVVVVISFALLV